MNRNWAGVYANCTYFLPGKLLQSASA